MRFSRRPRRSSTDKNLISLINIVFLILVFFMIMGRITRQDVIDVDPPASTSATAARTDGVVILIGSGGKVAVDTESISAATLFETLSRKIGRGDPAAIPAVTIKADGATRVEQLDKVLDVIRSLGVTRLSLVTDRSR